MRAINILMDEHRVIERVLDCLEKAASRMDAKETVRPALFIDAADFIRDYADGLHHMKEEKILFEEMAAKGMPKDGGPIGVMLYEHEQARALTRGMREAAERWEKGDEASRDEVIRNARDYAALLRQHIAKEDQILFPMAGNVLPPEDQKRLTGVFEEMESSEPSVSTREKYLALAGSLEQELGR